MYHILRLASLATVAGSTAAIFLGAQPAAAQDVNGPTQTGEICMQKVFGAPVTSSNRLNCTANDIRISGVATDPVTGEPLVDPATCIEGSTFDLTATFEINVTANERYDAGFFFRIDGGENARGDGTAASGLCSLSALDPAEAPALDLDGDTCGDLNAGTQQVTFTIPGVECVGVPDPDNPDQRILKLPNCTSWHSNRSTACNISTAFDFDPDTKSKCVCDDDFTVPVVVETATLTVVKQASPTEVPESGGEVTYTVQVTNDAAFVSVTLTTVFDDLYGDLTDPNNLAITDSTCGDLVGVVLGPQGSGTETGSCSFKADVSGNAGDLVTDVAEVCGDQEITNAEVCGDDDAVVTVTDVPAIPALDKTAQSASCTVDVTYQVVVSNNSDVPDTLTVNSLTDDVFGDITQVQGNVIDTDCATGTTIAQGGNYTCTFVGRTADTDCTFGLTDTVTGGVTDDDGNSYTPSDSATVNVNTTFP